MEDIKKLMKHHYIKYASYVILDRAIPHVIDGLKPVQRRILTTLRQMHDGKLHKVANTAGQTMALHPHGDASIIEALVNMANKEYLLDKQGNFGNIYTGDPSAAARYIETRLSPLAIETLFNPDLTKTIASYDGRQQEPIVLPAKIPLVLMQGIDGIAVGMATHILPHNFVELLEAEIAILEERAFSIVPDFLTGGLLDASGYENGKGKIKLRAKIEIVDPKTLKISEICYSTTTESLIRSIDEAAKRGKIKIEAIDDYTADKVDIEIKLPRGQYADDILDALYAYTECEVSISSQIIVIKDDLPWEPTVNEILLFHVEKLQEYFKIELEIEASRLNEKIFEKNLERLFIENRLYKRIEEISDYQSIHATIAQDLEKFHDVLSRIPSHDDRERLLNIPIRRISRFDIQKNQEEITAFQTDLLRVEKELKSIKKVVVKHLQNLIKKYGKFYPRKTVIRSIEEVDRRAIETKKIKMGYDPESGFLGTKVTQGTFFECTNFDRILIFFDNGSYTVVNAPEKLYIHHKGRTVTYVGAADKKTILNVAYRDPNTHLGYAKRFVIDKFTVDKNYRYIDEGMELDVISADSSLTLDLQFIPKPNQKLSKALFNFSNTLVKGVSAKGIRMASRPLKKVIAVESVQK
jgi:topoisomerase IV subunit A